MFLRSVTRAIEYEVWRQITALENGQTIENETRYLISVLSSTILSMLYLCYLISRFLYDAKNLYLSFFAFF